MAKAKTKTVQMLTSMAGEGFSYDHGARVEIAGKIADAWIEAGIAKECDNEEAATARADGLAHSLKSAEAELETLRARVAELEAHIAKLEAGAAQA